MKNTAISKAAAREDAPVMEIIFTACVVVFSLLAVFLL